MKHILRRLLSTYKPQLGKVYHAGKVPVKKLDRLFVRLLSLGRYFKPKKLPTDFYSLPLTKQIAALRLEDAAIFEQYNKSTNPTVVLQKYIASKHRLRMMLARLKHMLKESAE